MTRIISDYLRADRYGVYVWTPRGCASIMWPLRFWSIRRQRGPSEYRSGNVHAGPFYLAWYDRAAWAPRLTLRQRVRVLRSGA